MKGHHVKVVMPKLGLTGIQVFIDGEEIARVSSVALTASVDSYPVVTVKFWPESVEAEGGAIVEQVK